MLPFIVFSFLAMCAGLIVFSTAVPAKDRAERGSHVFAIRSFFLTWYHRVRVWYHLARMEVK